MKKTCEVQGVWQDSNKKRREWINIKLILTWIISTWVELLLYCSQLTFFNSILIKGVEHLREYKGLVTQNWEQTLYQIKNKYNLFFSPVEVCNYSFKCQEFHTHYGVLKLNNFVDIMNTNCKHYTKECIDSFHMISFY